MSMFKKAKRTESRLRLAIQGTSGSGKTYGALLIAKGLGGKIAVIDTERGSASLYAGMKDMPEFDTLNLNAPFTPEKYIEAIKGAEAEGYDIVIIDSMTHEWNGSSGCLEIVENIGRAKYRGNSWAAWNDVTPRHRAFVDAILTSPCHVIATMRSKQDTVQVENERGKKVVQKIGLKYEQRDGTDYEFTTVFDITDEHICTVSKDRTNLFKDPFTVSEATGTLLKDWLSSSEKPESKAVKTEKKVDVNKVVDETSEALAQEVENGGLNPSDIQDDPDMMSEVQIIGEFKQRIVEAETIEALKAIGVDIGNTKMSDEGTKELRVVFKNKMNELKGL